MNKKADRHNTEDDDMRPEYDFTGAVRGKYAGAFDAGYTVRVIQPDGSVEERHYPPRRNAIVLEPDVQKFFPDSESVNKALRLLIDLIPKKRKSA
jgi:hypothetical protein